MKMYNPKFQCWKCGNHGKYMVEIVVKTHTPSVDMSEPCKGYVPRIGLCEEHRKEVDDKFSDFVEWLSIGGEAEEADGD